jgi:hypothetical protein
MSVTITPFLRQVLRADALVSGAAGLLMALGAPYLAPFLDLPSGLLLGAGVALLPFVALLLVVAARTETSRLMLVDIIGINAMWVIASFGVLLSGAVAPNVLRYAFVVAQALAVALLAELQLVGMRRSASVNA